MTTNERYSEHHSDDVDDAQETDAPESRVTQAGGALDQTPDRVADVRHDGRLEEAAAAIGHEDAGVGTEAAIPPGRATEHIDRAGLTGSSRHERPQPNEADEVPAAELPIAERLRDYTTRLEEEYRQWLAEPVASCLQNLTAAEIAFIRGNEELRNKIAYTVQAFDIDQRILDLGNPYEDPFTPNDPEIAKRALELEARAIQVNAAFQAQAAEIARATNSLHMPGPVKTAHRIAEKMEKDYRSTLGRNETSIDLLASMVKDAVRCRIVVDGDPTIADQAVIETIEESGLHIAEDALHHPLIKQGFRDRRTGAPLDIDSGTRYLDTKVTVTVTVEVSTRDGSTTLCEIAIVTSEMAAATVSEHPVYEITRSLDGDERPMAVILLYHLREIQHALYRDVSQRISERVTTT